MSLISLLLTLEIHSYTPLDVSTKNLFQDTNLKKNISLLAKGIAMFLTCATNKKFHEIVQKCNTIKKHPLHYAMHSHICLQQRGFHSLYSKQTTPKTKPQQKLV